jgi:antitoxin ParD1/3/4
LSKFDIFSRQTYNKNMNVSLTAELEKFVHGKVDAGYFQNASEVVRSALRLMKERDADREHQMAWMQREVDRGWDEAKAGKLTSGAAVKSEMANFKRKWKAERKAATV